jgi:hypothetical protein
MWLSAGRLHFPVRVTSAHPFDMFSVAWTGQVGRVPFEVSVFL